MFVDSEIFVDHGTHLWIVLCGLQISKSNENFHRHKAIVMKYIFPS